MRLEYRVRILRTHSYSDYIDKYVDFDNVGVFVSDMFMGETFDKVSDLRAHIMD